MLPEISPQHNNYKSPLAISVKYWEEVHKLVWEQKCTNPNTHHLQININFFHANASVIKETSFYLTIGFLAHVFLKVSSRGAITCIYLDYHIHSTNGIEFMNF